MKIEIKNNIIYISTPKLKYLGINLANHIPIYMRKTTKL